MVSFLPARLFGRTLQASPASFAETASHAVTAALTQATPDSEPTENTFLLTLGWISAGFGALALGLFVGRELRQRYKFTRRTPYDFYAHSGDRLHDVEFGVGI